MNLPLQLTCSISAGSQVEQNSAKPLGGPCVTYRPLRISTLERLQPAQYASSWSAVRLHSGPSGIIVNPPAPPPPHPCGARRTGRCLTAVASRLRARPTPGSGPENEKEKHVPAGLRPCRTEAFVEACAACACHAQNGAQHVKITHVSGCTAAWRRLEDESGMRS